MTTSNSLPDQADDTSDPALVGPAPDANSTSMPPPISVVDDAKLRLPPDPEDPAFADRLQVLRSQFEDRTAFNFLVCDALAQRGVPPNSNNVVKAGRWGSSGNVASDVRAWYASIARRLADSQARIPDAARGRANELIEQLWHMANELTAKPLNDEIQRIQAEATQSHEAAMHAMEQMGSMQSEVAALKASLATALEQSARLEASLGQAHEAHASEVSRLEFVASEVALTHMHELRQAAQTLAAARATASAEMDAMRQSAVIALEAEQSRFASAAAAHESAVSTLREAIARLQNQLDAERRAIALTLDQSRQDVREANARADQAEQRAASERAEQNRLRELNATAGIDLARAQMQRDQAIEALRKMQAAKAATRVKGEKSAP